MYIKNINIRNLPNSHKGNSSIHVQCRVDLLESICKPVHLLKKFT